MTYAFNHSAYIHDYLHFIYLLSCVFELHLKQFMSNHFLKSEPDGTPMMPDKHYETCCDNQKHDVLMNAEQEVRPYCISTLLSLSWAFLIDTVFCTMPLYYQWAFIFLSLWGMKEYMAWHYILYPIFSTNGFWWLPMDSGHMGTTGNSESAFPLSNISKETLFQSVRSISLAENTKALTLCTVHILN